MLSCSAMKKEICVVALFIESASWSCSSTSNQAYVNHKRSWRMNDYITKTSLLLYPDEYLRAFGQEAQDLYFGYEDERQEWFFFENITSIAESDQASFYQLF